jgi:enoyl-CoA hydratase
MRPGVNAGRCTWRGREAPGAWYTARMAVYATILVDDTGPVARVTLNRPEKRNPIGPTTCGELVQALTAIKAKPEARVVVLTGAGAVFSAGGDLSALQPASDGPIASLVDLLVAMHELGKPIIAMVNGPALAGGLGLMVACDLVVAADTATFGTTEIAVGLWPMMITAEITRSVGRKKTLEMMLTGRKLDAAEALACGLVTRVVPAAELEAATYRLAGELADKSPAALALGLHAFYRSQDMEFEPQLRYLQAELSRVLALDDAREGIAAFLGKRKPVWTGK